MKTKLRLKLALLGLLLSVVVVPLRAQISEGGLPPSFAYDNITKQAKVPTTLPVTFDVKQLKVEDAQKEADGHPLRAAMLIPADLNIGNSGEWSTLPNGQRVWRLSLRAPGAIALALYYEEFYIPKGGKLFIYNKDKTHVLGAYTYRTNPKGRAFATELVTGDELTLEYVMPLKGKSLTPADRHSSDTDNAVMDGTNAIADDAEADMPRISISSIGYGYNHITVYSGDRLKLNNPGNECMINVNCSEGEDWKHEKTGVAKTLTPVGSGSYLCSGTIVNNTANDLDPLYLSAYHCFNINGQTARYDQMTFYFHYEFPGCNNLTIEPTSTKTMAGADLLVSISLDGGSDGSLLRLRLPIPESYNVFYNGWDRANTPATSGVGIHHPQGDVKKISTYTTPAISSTANMVTGEVGATNAHWRIVFASTANGHSVTEEGSSGSPMFNQDHRVVGSLTGGSSTCTNLTGTNIYGKLWYHWDQHATQKMAPYLDPGNTGVERIDGIYAGGNVVVNFSASKTELYASESVTFTDLSYNATSWEWTFAGGIPAGFTGQTPPDVLYNIPGDHDAKLVINAGTADEKEKTITIKVKQKQATCPVTQEIGTGTSVAQFPLGMLTRQSVSSSIYTSTELGGAGVISSLSWQATNATSMARILYVYLKEVDDATQTAGTWANEIAGATLVYQSGATYVNDAGWVNVKLTTPFTYSGGTKNLKVIVRSVGAAATPLLSSDCYYTTTTNTHMEWTATTTTAPAGNGTVNDNRPNIRITLEQDCGAVAPVADFTAGLNDVLLKEGFDVTVFPISGWTIEKTGASPYRWEPANLTNYNFNLINPASTRSAFVRFDATNVINTRMISPPLSITDAATKLDFYALYEGIKLANAQMSLYVSTDGGTTWGTAVWTTGNTNSTMGMAWRKQSVSLSAYNGQTIKLAWEYVGQNGGYMAFDDVMVYAPNADGKTTIFEGQSVSFADLSTGPPVLWRWTLPNGNPASSELQNPVARYMQQGVYDATLAVTNNFGSDTKTITGAVTVMAQTPVPAFASTSNGFILQANRGQFLPLTGGLVELTDTSANYPTSRLWTLTGATPASSTDKTAEALYPAGENSYPVTLSATNIAGTASITIPDYVKVGGTAEVWNVLYSETPNIRYNNQLGYAITGADAYPQTAERFEAPAAGEISKVRIYTQSVTAGTNQMIVGIFSDNKGVPGTLLSPTMAIAGTSLVNGGYNTITFPNPVGVSGTFHIVVGSTNYANTYFTVPCVADRAAAYNTVSVLRTGVWVPISTAFTGLGTSMNIVPEFTYTTAQLVGTTSFQKKNIDPVSETISFTTNASSWQVSADSWIELSTTGGTGSSGSFSFTVKDNIEANPRNGLITVKAGGNNLYAVVQQVGTNPTKLKAIFMDDSEEAVALTWKAPVTTVVDPANELFDDAEGHTSFTINSAGSAGWSYIDGDGANTYAISGLSYPGSESPVAFVVFDPTQTTPPSTAPNTRPHSGNKYFACFAAVPPAVNNDWMVSPLLSFPTDFKFSFWAKSASSQYTGGERMRVVYSTSGKAQEDFIGVLTAEPYVVVPQAAWTRYQFTVPADAKYVAINCVTNDEFLFMLDDIFIGIGVAPASAIATADATKQNVGTVQPELFVNNLVRRPIGEVQPSVVTKKSTYKLEAAPTTNGTSSQSSLGSGGEDILMAAGATAKLRWDNGANRQMVGLASGGNIEVAVRFEAPDMLRFHGLKLLAVDIFPRNLGNSMVLNIRQNGVVVHSQPISGLTVGAFNRITLTTPLVIDAGKELMIGYAYAQLPGSYVAGCDAGPAVRGKGDLISLNGEPFEALSRISPLNYNWNIAGVIENKTGTNIKLEYNVYRNSTKIATVSPTAYDDLTNIDRNTCYNVTALYNDVLESTPSNENCVTARHPITVGVVNVTRTVGQLNPTFVLTYTGFEDGDTEAVINVKPTAMTTASAISPVGTYPITILGGSDDKYQFVYVPGTLTIEQKEVVVTATNTVRTVGQVNPTFALTYTGFIDGDTDAVLDTKPVATSVADHTSPAGTYPIVPAGGVDDKYKLTYVSGTLTVVDRVELIVSVNSVSRNIGEANPTFVLQYSGFVGGDTPASLAQQPVATCFATPASPAGTYPIIVSGGADSKYKFTYVPGTLTVTAATQIELVVGVKSVLRFYGENNPPFELQYSGFVGGDTPASLAQQPVATCFATPTSFAGTYPITVSGGVDSKYKLAYVPGTLTVVRRPLTITVQDVTRKVGQADPVFRLTYSGFVDGDTPLALAEVPIAATAAGAESTAGTYTITLSGGRSDKYEITVVPGTLTIEKWQLLVGVKNITRREGDANPTFELTYSGFVDGDNATLITNKPTASSTANALSPAGTYPITLNGGSNNKYEFTLVPGTLTVTAAPVNKQSNAFTPYDLDGYNDVFMAGTRITVVNRYGQLVFEGNDGWNGKKKNSSELVPPGVYYYHVTFSDGTSKKGSVNVIKK